ncbi:MAG: GspH/FimT family pseudopilin [Luteimonas sp.]
MSRQRGFTLIELLVAISIVAILLTIAVPSFQAAMNANRLSSAANEMVASLQTARMEAIRRNQRTVVCFSANPTATAPGCATSGLGGWVAFVDNSNPHNTTFDAGTDELLRSSTFKAPVVVSGLSPVTYRSDGMARTAAGAVVNGSVNICIATTQPAQNMRRVNVGSGSRVSVSTDPTNVSCP